MIVPARLLLEIGIGGILSTHLILMRRFSIRLLLLLLILIAHAHARAATLLAECRRRRWSRTLLLHPRRAAAGNEILVLRNMIGSEYGSAILTWIARFSPRRLKLLLLRLILMKWRILRQRLLTVTEFTSRRRCRFLLLLRLRLMTEFSRRQLLLIIILPRLLTGFSR